MGDELVAAGSSKKALNVELSCQVFGVLLHLVSRCRKNSKNARKGKWE